VLNRREAAAKQLREATEADPKLWRALNGLGLLGDLKQQPAEAADFYRKALSLNPESAVIFNNLGYSRLLAGKPDEAMGHLKKALGLDPGSETIQNNLRLAMAAKGNYAEATRSVSKEQMATVLNNVGYVAMQKGDIAAAEGYLARAMESSPSFNTVASKNLEQLKAMKAGSP
jgi:Flp pilus assembly protein TadD